MLNPFQLMGPWLMIGGAALLLLLFLAVFVWNSPRRDNVVPREAAMRYSNELGIDRSTPVRQ